MVNLGHRSNYLSAIIVWLTVSMATGRKLNKAYHDISYQCYTNEQCEGRSWVTSVYGTNYCCQDGDTQNVEAFGSDGTFLGLREMLMGKSDYFGIPFRDTAGKVGQIRPGVEDIRHVDKGDVEDYESDKTPKRAGEESDSKKAMEQFLNLGRIHLKKALRLDDVGNAFSATRDQFQNRGHQLNSEEAKYRVLNKREVLNGQTASPAESEINPHGHQEIQSTMKSITAKLIKPNTPEKEDDEERGEVMMTKPKSGDTTKSSELGDKSPDEEQESESRELHVTKKEISRQIPKGELQKVENSASGSSNVNEKNIRPQARGDDEKKTTDEAEKVLGSEKQTSLGKMPVELQKPRPDSSHHAKPGKNQGKNTRGQKRVVCTCGAYAPMHFKGPLNFVQKMFTKLWNFAAPMFHIPNL